MVDNAGAGLSIVEDWRYGGGGGGTPSLHFGGVLLQRQHVVLAGMASE